MRSKSNEILGFIPRRNTFQFFLVTMLFLMWGIPNNLNDVLIKQFMKSFELTRFQAGLIQSAFYLGYFFLALPSGLVIKKISYKVGLLIGLFLFALGCFMFYPAAIIGKYYFFLFALFVIASGLTFLETAANIFIVTIGKAETSERRLNFTQAFNPIGAVLGVLIGTIFIFSGIEYDSVNTASMKDLGLYQSYLKDETMRVVMPYIILALVALFWGVLILISRFPKETVIVERGKKSSLKELFIKHPHFPKGVLSQFLYCGAQTCTWSFFIQYIQDYTGQPEKMAGYLLTGTLVAFGIGRFSATYFMRFILPNKLLGIYSIINILLVGMGILFPGIIGMWAIFFTSFFMSLMYPTNFALSVRNLGENTKLAGSIMVMAIVGGAFFPPLMGHVAESTDSMAIAMSIPLGAYIYIAFFGFVGSRMKRTNSFN